MRSPSRREVLASGAAVVCLGYGPESRAASAGSIRLTSVRAGSVSWLVETMLAEGIDKKHNFKLEVLNVANNTAAPVALLAGSADVIVSDWTWAQRQRAKGQDFKFAPYSTALGCLMVAKDSEVTSLADLSGKRLGVAGTGIDKSWILLRAYSRKVLGKDVANFAKPIFGAAPLVTEEFSGGRLDAVLDFWTFAARLKAKGARELLTMAHVVEAMDIRPIPALVGFIWSEKAVADRGVPIEVFLQAVADTNSVLAKSDAAWERLRPLIKPASDAELDALKDYYRSGITNTWGGAETAAAEKLTNLLIEIGDTELIGDGIHFDPKLFHSTTG